MSSSFQSRLLFAFVVLGSLAPVFAQRELSGTPEIKLALDRLNVTASVLMIAAHPDDENTALLAWLSRGRKVRTGYLSLTRGEGGQNLIGSEQGDALGVIRTQELLAARRIDGAEQFFTRAIDFGFTKTTDETFEKWGHDKILSDVVWVIRRFRPDVIILRFSGTPRDGHGQHQVSAILGKEAFSAAADKTKFPEQLKWVQPWQATRLMWNVFSFNREQEKDAEKLTGKIEVDPGDYDPVLGHSYGEIAGMSRSLHRSQGMGAPERKGSQKNFLVTIAGQPASKDLFDGVDKTWDSIPGSARVSQLLLEAARTFEPDHPGKTTPILLNAEPLMAALKSPIAERKHHELLDAIALTSGLWLDATSDRYAVMPGGTIKFTATALNREDVPFELKSVDVQTGDSKGAAQATPAKPATGPLPHNVPRATVLTATIAPDLMYSQPYWLREPKQGATYTVPNQLQIGLPEEAPLFQARFRLRSGDRDLEFLRPVTYRYVDHVQGELTRPVVVEPPVALGLPERALVFPSASPKQVEVQIRANLAGQSGKVSLQAPAGWKVEPASLNFQLGEIGQETVAVFEVTPPRKETKAVLRATADLDGRKISVGTILIAYPHIPPQTLFPPAATDLTRADIQLAAKTIGYVMGAGDDVPEALRQLGASVTLLAPEDLSRGDLSRFEAIVTGVRAYNTRPDLRANQQRLLAYVNKGGTMVVQYNVLEGGFGGGDPTLLNHIGPYPITTGRERVTVEEAPMVLPHPDSPLLRVPNAITQNDFTGWVQERGLYFASEWDPRYTPLFATQDPGEKPMLGGTLYTKYGKGAYVFTAFSWFRQLPAGVPGAFRIFANFLSAGKSL